MTQRQTEVYLEVKTFTAHYMNNRIVVGKNDSIAKRIDKIRMTKQIKFAAAAALMVYEIMLLLNVKESL